MSPERLRIVLLGYLVRGPLGGLAWHHLQYLIGLSDLGHDAYFLEDSEDFASCYLPDSNEMSSDPTFGLGWTGRIMDRLDLGARWAYFDAHSSSWHGPCAQSALEVCRSADIVLDLSAVTPIRPWLLDAPVRALVDTDPAITQVANLTDEWARDRAATHTHFFTFGSSVGTEGYSVPGDGFPWQPTRQPVTLEKWPVHPGPVDGRLTTIMQWEAHDPVEHDGRRFGPKRDSFMSGYLDLPRRVGRLLELAVGSRSAPRDLLRDNGWVVVDPRGPSRDPLAYQDYIRSSAGEWSVASEAYVATRSGWFSERSTAFLASARPVVVQDTGFSSWLPTGLGIIPFSSPDEAAAGILDLYGRYREHSCAARRIVEEHFDAGTVLTDLVTRMARTP
ncbi:MAG TPA: hypothetical protein VFW24_14695, partial [Acidimicrobiales bacterium]|nr:hypothetical protein [Acidimicrobiales bacterium]